MADKSKLKRELHEMPDFVLAALERYSLIDAYRDRPAYQQNDYLGWIDLAKRDSTKQKRLQQMLDELKRGGVYMKMEHSSSKR